MLFVCLVEGKRGEACVVDPIDKAYVRSDDQIILAPLLRFDSQYECRHVHRREKLAGMLWPDSLEETAGSNLRSALWKIRKALPSSVTAEYLFADDLTVAFNASAEYWLDAAELEKVSENASADVLNMFLLIVRGAKMVEF